MPVDRALRAWERGGPFRMLMFCTQAATSLCAWRQQPNLTPLLHYFLLFLFFSFSSPPPTPPPPQLLQDKDIPAIKESGTFVAPSAIRRMIGDDSIDLKSLQYQDREVRHGDAPCAPRGSGHL